MTEPVPKRLLAKGAKSYLLVMSNAVMHSSWTRDDECLKSSVAAPAADDPVIAEFSGEEVAGERSSVAAPAANDLVMAESSGE